MRKIGFVVALCLSTAVRIPAQAGPGLVTDPIDAATRAELLTAREAVWRAWFAGDTAALERLLPAALAAGSPQGWERRPETIADAKRSAASGRRLVSISFDSTVITLRGAVAVMQARYATVVEAPDGKRVTTRGVATEIFVRENKRWVNPFWYLE